MGILNGAELLRRARQLADDRVEPYFTDDILMYSFITEAERELAVTGKMLRVPTTYKVKDGTQFIELGDDIEVLEFRSAEFIEADTQRHYPLKLIGALDTPPTYPYFDYGITSEQPRKQRPTALIFGKEYGVFEVTPISDRAGTIEAQLIIYPTDPIEKSTDEPTIPVRYHPSIPIGAAFRAVEAYAATNENRGRLQSLTSAWGSALARAAKETAAINRDSVLVQFNSPMWDNEYTFPRYW